MSDEMGEVTINLVTFPSLRHVMGTDWRERANCSDLPKSMFFDYNAYGLKHKEKKERIELAQEVCKYCPVRSQCYEFSVLNNEPYGIWAGTFPKQRRKLFQAFRETGILEPLPTA